MATTKASLRQIWFQIHKWVGIILAIVLIPLSLSGSVLVWDEALDGWINPQRHAVTGPVALPATAYVAAAAKALPADAKIASLSMPDAGDALTVSAAPKPQAGPRRGPPQRMAVWLDPATGKLLDVGAQGSAFIRFMHSLHGNLTIPGSGRAIVGWLGVAMSISCLTGLWLWWPMVGKLARAFRWKRQPQFDVNLHHMVGFWISVPLAILSITGVIIAWPQMMGASGERGGPPGTPPARAENGGARDKRVRDGQPGRGAQSKAPQEGGGGRGFDAPPLATTNLTIDQAIAAAGIKAPFTVSWPTSAEPAWRVSSGGGARKTVMVDDATGAPKAARGGAGGGPGGGGQRPLVRRLHDGTDMGLVWQIIIVLGGIAPAALGITGITMWLRTRRWRGDVARRTRARRGTAAAE